MKQRARERVKIQKETTECFIEGFKTWAKDNPFFTIESLDYYKEELFKAIEEELEILENKSTLKR